MSTTTSSYHVYADDGFEGAHRSLAAAERAAKRGSTRRDGVTYSVVRTSAAGLTGGGHGVEMARYIDGAVRS